MKFKIDENLSELCCDVLNVAGYDAMSVDQQGMSGDSDSRLAEVCEREGRIIVTADLDFADIRDMTVRCSHGVIVFRLTDQSAPRQIDAVSRVVGLLTTHVLAGHIWIVDEKRVRMRAILTSP